MKQIIIIILFFLNFSSGYVSGQTVLLTSETKEQWKELPKERIFLHYNSSLLFSGEYLYYKIYNINSETGALSPLSKIAYVEVVGKDGNTIIKNKILLEEGTGQGDFFIPTTLASGNYKVVAYTQWMVNGGTKEFFQGNLTILNPYRGDQTSLLAEGKTAAESGSDINTSVSTEGLNRKQNSGFSLISGNKNFEKRERVSLNFGKGSDEILNGNYSVSVRKIDFESAMERPTAKEFEENSGKLGNLVSPDKNNLYLPELRGDLLTGTLTRNTADGNLPVENIEVALSIPGQDFVFKVASTNADGKFYFNLNEKYSGTNGIIQILAENPENYSIELEQSPAVNFDSLEYSDFFITPSMKEMILKRSIYNQVENAYYGVKPDTVITPEANGFFYGDKAIVYNLDDYTRFSTVQETFIEIIQNVWITRTGSGTPTFKVRAFEGSLEFRRPPLLLVDGVFVQDHQSFLELPARAIQSISIIRENLYFGPLVFQGVISVRTVDGNFYVVNANTSAKEIELEKPEPVKNYYRQTYSEDNKENRIPDFRYQLAWIPNLEINGEEAVINFFTSDVEGEYQISIEGFTNAGVPVSVEEIITVK